MIVTSIAVLVVGFIAYQVGVSVGMDRQSGARDRSSTPHPDLITDEPFDRETSPSELLPENQDTWEGDFREALAPFPVKAALQIIYVDSQSRTRDRVVDVWQCDPSLYGGMVIGRCRLRNATRTFRLDRIQSCVDADTGEVIDDVRGYLQEKYETSVGYSLNKTAMNYPDVIRILHFVGKADGQLRKAENEVIAEYLANLSGDQRITADDVKRLLASYEVDTIHAYKKAVDRLAAQQSDVRGSLISALQAIVDTGKTMTGTEQEALDYGRGRLSAS